MSRIAIPTECFKVDNRETIEPSAGWWLADFLCFRRISAGFSDVLPKTWTSSEIDAFCNELGKKMRLSGPGTSIMGGACIKPGTSERQLRLIVVNGTRKEIVDNPQRVTGEFEKCFTWPGAFTVYCWFISLPLKKTKTSEYIEVIRKSMYDSFVHHQEP